MRKPAIFVSSTFYDLKQVRADLSIFIERLGCEPVLSEFDTFPLHPDISTAENCTRVVETNADIFVLIVGNRYGSLTKDGRSVTNLEYLVAKAKGIPIYTFVDKAIITALKIWKRNKSADFSAIVDDTNLFEFVSEIYDTGSQWVYGFEVAQEIVSTLRNQFAYLFMEALDLRFRAAHSGLQPSLRKELHGTVLRIAIERPPGWGVPVVHCCD